MIFPRLFAISLGVWVLLLNLGCATTSKQTTERMLAASGFKVVPVTTPDQQKQLATLPKGKISVIKRQGKVFFIYPDSSQKQLYVGQNAQYSAYQKLLLNREAMEASLEAANAANNAEALNAQATIISNDPWGVFEVWYP